MILTMVGLQAIPGDVYEAASLDGASKISQLWRITIPLLRPTIAMTMILSITGSLLAFDQFYILTKGGPNNSTMTVVLLIYRYSFETRRDLGDRKSTRLNSSHVAISYAVYCLTKQL